jgi:hypothetical protein
MEYVQKVKPIVETALQIARQIDRFSQIELQERRRRQKETAGRNR